MGEKAGHFGFITRKLVDSTRWRAILDDTANRDCLAYSSAFEQARKLAEKDGHAEEAAVYRLIQAAFDFSVRASDGHGPYIPTMVFGGNRTPLPGDFEEHNLDVLVYLAECTNDPEFRARIYDIAWDRRKHQELGRCAVESYLKSADALLATGDGLDQYRVIERLERACQIGHFARLDRDGPSPCSAPLYDLKSRMCRGKDFLSYSILRLICEYHLTEEPAALAAEIEQLADSPATEEECRAAEGMLTLAEKVWLGLGEEDKARLVRLKLAQCVEKQYLSHRQDGAAALQLAHHLGRTIEAYRRAGGQREKVDAFELNLKELRKQSLSEMKSLVRTTDISNLVEIGRKLVAGKDIVMALLLLGDLPFVPKADIRKLVEEEIKRYPLFSLVTRQTFDAFGNLISIPPSAIGSDPELVERGIEAHMYEKARFLQEAYGASYIDAARIEIMQSCREFDLGLTQVLFNNAFIPRGREEVYFRGFKAGFLGDWLACTHFLLPQIEHSLRTVIASNGVKVTSASGDDSRIQNEHDLGTLLRGDGGAVIERVFGEGMLFELRVLLIDKEKGGANLRNVVAHGLIDPFLSRGIGNYFLWLALRLVVRGTYSAIYPVDTSSTHFHRLSPGFSPKEEKR